MFGSFKKFPLVALAAMTTLSLTGAARAEPAPAHGRHDHVSRLASRLEREARYLNRETDSHFRSTPDYRQFERQVDDIVRMADHINDIARRGGSLGHLRADVSRLDRFYHWTERLFERMVAHRRLDRETVVHLRRALNAVERTIHELRDAIN
jgi:hypothetical protein